MTTETNTEHTAEAYHLYTLIEHDFITGLRSGLIKDVGNCYIRFTKTVVSLFHRHHCKEEIRSALHLVEDHLVIMLEDIEELCEMLRKFLNRALNFIKKFVGRLSDRLGKKGKSEEKAGADEGAEGETETFSWDAPFTELVELTDALLSEKKLGNVVNARFIKAFFGLLGVNKTTSDYYRALRKLQEKAPKNDEGTGRSKLLVTLWESTEERWRKIYDGD